MSGCGIYAEVGLEIYLQQTIINFVVEGLGVAFVPHPCGARRSRGQPSNALPILRWWSKCCSGLRATSIRLAGFLNVCEALKAGAKLEFELAKAS